MFTAEVIGIRELVREWADAERALGAGIRHAVERGVKEGADEAKSAHRYKDRTGNLTRSIRGYLTVSSQYDAHGEIVAAAKYASFVEEGTPPHEILPLNYHWGSKTARTPTSRVNGRKVHVAPGVGRGRALRWVSGGVVHFASRVNHPGSKPYPFMSLAYIKCERVVIREIELAVPRAQAALS